MMRRLVIGNWKMNLGLSESLALAQGVVRLCEKYPKINIAISPSALWLVPLRESIRWCPPNFYFASQSVSSNPQGAYTGDIAASQLKQIVTYCIVGHSERRKYHHETHSDITHMIRQLLEVKIQPVLCFGEMTQTKSGDTSRQVIIDLKHDLAGLTNEEVNACIFAYERIWAISTFGAQPASPHYVEKTVRAIKDWFKEQYNSDVPVLYGGSVNEENAEDLSQVTCLDGALVGGASLHVKSFSKICGVFMPHV